jgi:chromosome segregation ATPase
VDHQENVELEARLLTEKATLKAQKNEVADLVAELERQGRGLAQRHEEIQLQTTQLKELPAKINRLEKSIEELRAKHAPGKNPNLNLSLQKTKVLVEEKDKEQRELDRQIEQLQGMLPRKTRELERLEAELGPLEVKRSGTLASAKEAKRRREAAAGGVADDLEERGRWWRGVEVGVKGMLGVEN